MSPFWALWFKSYADTVRALGVPMSEWQWRVLYLALRGARWTIDLPRGRRQL